MEIHGVVEFLVLYRLQATESMYMLSLYVKNSSLARIAGFQNVVGPVINVMARNQCIETRISQTRR